MNSVRIRVIDERFVIVSDSYLVEYGRNIINSNVINSFTTGKSISFYDRKNTNIEVAVPINGTDGSILGVLVVSKDLDEVYKNSVMITYLQLWLQLLQLLLFWFCFLREE